MINTRTWFRNNGSHSKNVTVDRHSDAFPVELERIRVYGERSYAESNSVDFDHYSCNYLAKMIRESSTKIPKVDIDYIDPEETTPEYLSLLVSILKKADSLTIESLGGDAAYGCFMGSMLQQNGLREITISCDEGAMSTYQAELLFEGIAVSQSLEKLDLNGMFSEPAEAMQTLANALKRNHSLTTLHLYVKLEDGDTALGDLFKSAITDKRIHDFYINQIDGHQKLPFDVMAEVLCTDNCAVKKLDMMEPMARAHSLLCNNHIESLQNTSVTHYTLNYTSLDCFRIMETVSLFNSIKELNLAHNQISDLSPLDPLLVGDNLTLETLELMCNRIDEKDVVEFFRKIPKMTCLRKVSLTFNPFISSSGSWKGVLAEAAWQNRSLECINCVYDYSDNDNYNPNDFPEFHLPFSLNRGGRRALEIESSTPLPANLWPQVLERAGKISYFSTSDDSWNSPSLDSTRTDVVYWLLREKMLESCLHG